MARKAPTGIHSEFRARMAFTVRAPEGDSMRSMLMRRLVQEMGELHASGNLMDWMVGALLDKVASGMVAEQAGHLALKPIQQNSQWTGAASQPGEGQSLKPDAPSEAVVVLPGKVVDSQVKAVESILPAPTSVALPVGLRAM